MSRTNFTTHQGKRILVMDFSSLSDIDSGLAHIGEAKRIVAQQPKASLLVVVDTTDSKFDRNTIAALRDLAEHDKPFVIASALVGISGLKSTVMNTVARLVGRSFKTFDNRQAAMDWLIGQGE